jgi:hypothetical protein
MPQKTPLAAWAASHCDGSLQKKRQQSSQNATKKPDSKSTHILSFFLKDCEKLGLLLE